MRAGATVFLALSAPVSGQDAIISGSGAFRYQYMPDLVKMPAGTSGASTPCKSCNMHGLSLDAENNIYLTYQPEAPDACGLVRWKPDGTSGEKMSQCGAALSHGTPHGLRIAHEDDGTYLYHANNNQRLIKTTLNGTIVWEVDGPPNNDTKWNPYRPTWHATIPGSPYVWMADGYGSSYIHVYEVKTGKYVGKSYGGVGTTHGKFHTPHSITYDPRVDKLVVTDRSNHRHEYYDFDKNSADVFTYNSTLTHDALSPGTLPCTFRWENGNGSTIVPDLNGPVGILDKDHKLVSTIEVSKLLGAQGHKHPHDAIFLPNGDFIVATWAPGRISYWKKL